VPGASSVEGEQAANAAAIKIAAAHTLRGGIVPALPLSSIESMGASPCTNPGIRLRYYQQLGCAAVRQV
jgi:hypothetical protein